MIDKNGKIFGKINIIDLLIILVIIAAAVFFATKAFTPAQEASESETTTLRVVFCSNKAPSGIAESIEIGSPAFEDTTDVPLCIPLKSFAFPHRLVRKTQPTVHIQQFAQNISYPDS